MIWRRDCTRSGVIPALWDTFGGWYIGRLLRKRLVILRQKLVRAGQPWTGRAVIGTARWYVVNGFGVIIKGDFLTNAEAWRWVDRRQ
jgi:hypothetical protein